MSEQSILVDYDLPQSVARVWRVLTEPALLSRWLMQNDIRAEVGHRFTFKAQPMGTWDGIVHCEVLAVEHEKLLRYSWRGGSDEVGRLDTVVTWTLAASKTGGTLLHLEHAGFTAKNKFAYEMMGKGWREKLAQQIAKVCAEM